MEKIFAPEEGRELIRGWLVHARKSWKKQEEASRRLESQYRRIGMASVILSAVVGASLFSSLEKEPEPWMKVIAGIVSISASVLASLLTFQRYEERTERHRAAGFGYKDAVRALERMHALPQERGLDQQELTQINDQLDKLENVAPVVPKDINDAVEKSYAVYEFEDKAEKLRSVQEGKG